jgi:intron-binding protein aquarius
MPPKGSKKLKAVVRKVDKPVSTEISLSSSSFTTLDDSHSNDVNTVTDKDNHDINVLKNENNVNAINDGDHVHDGVAVSVNREDDTNNSSSTDATIVASDTTMVAVDIESVQDSHIDVSATVSAMDTNEPSTFVEVNSSSVVPTVPSSSSHHQKGSHITAPPPPPTPAPPVQRYDVKHVRNIFKNDLHSGNHPSKYHSLDMSGYLENYLWHFFDAEVCFEHLMSILLMVNEKYRNGSPILQHMSREEEKCQVFYELVVDTYLLDEQQTMTADSNRTTNGLRTDWRLMEQFMLFFINSYHTIENPVIRSCVLRYLSLPLWESLSTTRLEVELVQHDQTAKNWKLFQAQKASLQRHVVGGSSNHNDHEEEGDDDDDNNIGGGSNKAIKKNKKSNADRSKRSKQVHSAENALHQQKQLRAMQRDGAFLPSLLQSLVSMVFGHGDDRHGHVSSNKSNSVSVVRCIERCLELLIDLLSQVTTRRFLKVLIDDMHLPLILKSWLASSSAISSSDKELLEQLVAILDHYMHFEVDDHTRRALTVQETNDLSNAKIHQLQQVAYTHFNDDLKDLVFCSVGELSKRESLMNSIQVLDSDQLIDLAMKLSILTEKDLSADSPLEITDEFVIDLLMDSLLPRTRQIDELNMIPLYPTETLLWDTHQLPLSSRYSNNAVLSLPKLNLQFLSIHDYLLRNFKLFRLESSFEIRDNLTDAIKRMGPKPGFKGLVSFTGWSRMAVTVSAVTVDAVRTSTTIRQHHNMWDSVFFFFFYNMMMAMMMMMMMMMMMIIRSSGV